MENAFVCASGLSKNNNRDSEFLRSLTQGEGSIWK